MVATIDSIRLECSCGKKARVPARYAGRKVRCTRCKAKLRVPGSGSDLEDLDREVARTSRSPRRNERRDERRPERSRSPQRSRSRAKSTDPYAPPKAAVDSPRRADRSARADRDLTAEGHIQAIAVWQRVNALLVGIAGVFLLFGGLRGLPIAAIAFGISAFCYWLAQSLKAYRGWARIVVGLFSLLGILGCMGSIVSAPSAVGMITNLISAAWNGAIIWALFSPQASRVFAPGYRIDDQRVRYWLSPFFWLPFALIALAGLMAFSAIAMRVM